MNSCINIINKGAVCKKISMESFELLSEFIENGNKLSDCEIKKFLKNLSDNKLLFLTVTIHNLPESIQNHLVTETMVREPHNIPEKQVN